MTEIFLEQGDITRISADAIVNAANKTLLGGGGVDGAIHKAAGPELLAECITLGGCETGQAKMTKGYNLPARHVIHTVGPVWSGGTHNEQSLLAGCYLNSLKLAVAHGLRTVAFPSISTGAYRFPIELAAPIALKNTKVFIDAHPDSLDKIIFVLFSARDLDIYLECRRSLR
jgi:O-acetyl-ADP-ribose deacetylase